MRSRRPGTKGSGLFSFRNSRLFFAGQLISQTGSSMQVVALGWLALQLSHNGFVLGLVTAAPILAMLVVAAVIAASAVSYGAVVAALLFMRPGELYARRKAPRARSQLWRAVGYLSPRLDLLLLLAITAVVSVFATSLPPLLLLLADRL